MRIDLHTHSSVSDGTESPAELLGTARAAGLDVVALTDHDTTAGWAEAEAARPSGLTVVPAWSCPAGGSRRPAADQRPPAGLPVRPAPPGPPPSGRGCGTSGSSAASGSSRRSPPPGTRSGGSGSSSGPTAVSSVARTSRALVEAGVATRSTTPSRRCCTTGARTTRRRPTPTSARGSRWSVRPGGAGVRPRARHEAGPDRGRRDRGDGRGRAARPGGRPPRPRADERAHLRGLAADLGLIVTGSSDYHGSNKRHRRLHDRPDQFEAILAAGTGSAPFRD